MIIAFRQPCVKGYFCCNHVWRTAFHFLSKMSGVRERPYRFRYLQNINMDKASAISSAAGVASQTPFTPNSAGRTSMAISMNTKEREKARTAEIIPLDNAVNIPLAKILKPIKNSAAPENTVHNGISEYTHHQTHQHID